MHFETWPSLFEPTKKVSPTQVHPIHSTLIFNFFGWNASSFSIAWFYSLSNSNILVDATVLRLSQFCFDISFFFDKWSNFCSKQDSWSWKLLTKIVLRTFLIDDRTSIAEAKTFLMLEDFCFSTYCWKLLISMCILLCFKLHGYWFHQYFLFYASIHRKTIQPELHSRSLTAPVVFCWMFMSRSLMSCR